MSNDHIQFAFYKNWTTRKKALGLKDNEVVKCGNSKTI